MDGFFDFDDSESEFHYNKIGGTTVPDMLDYLAQNLNLIVAVSRTESPMLDRIEFFIKPSFNDGQDGSDDGGGDGGIPTNPKPLPPRRPVEFEFEA